MKQASLVGEYSYYRAMPCEMEDVDFCQMMAWYQEAKVRYLVFSVKSTDRKRRFPCDCQLSLH